MAKRARIKFLITFYLSLCILIGGLLVFSVELFAKPWVKEKIISSKQDLVVSEHVDQLYSFLISASIIACILLVGALIYFAFRYRIKPTAGHSHVLQNNRLMEFMWSFIPFFIFMLVFGWGWSIFNKSQKPPGRALEIQVVGKQWAWEFIYDNGKTSPDLYMPAFTNIKLVLTSKDVLHALFVPGLGVKQDVVPEMYTVIWFNSKAKGKHQVFCSQFCGKKHMSMLAKAVVLSKEDFKTWNNKNIDIEKRLISGNKN